MCHHFPWVRPGSGLDAHNRHCPRATRLFPVLVAGFESARLFISPAQFLVGRRQIAVMAAGAWVLYAWFAADWDKRRFGFATGNKGIRIERMSLWPGLNPLWRGSFRLSQSDRSAGASLAAAHVSWAYFTGATFIGAGVAVLIGVCARLAATLSALQIGLFTLLVWLPIVVAGPNAFQWCEFVVSWALTAGGWMVADSYRGMPWLASRQALAPSPHVIRLLYGYSATDS